VADNRAIYKTSYYV